MRRTAAVAASLFAILAVSATAEAQEVHVRGPLQLKVSPRSWLDAGNTVAPYSSVNPASAAGQTISYMLNPPYVNMKDRFGEGRLPDPLTGPFVGAQNLLGPVDYNGLYNYPLN